MKERKTMFILLPNLEYHYFTRHIGKEIRFPLKREDAHTVGLTDYIVFVNHNHDVSIPYEIISLVKHGEAHVMALLSTRI